MVWGSLSFVFLYVSDELSLRRNEMAMQQIYASNSGYSRLPKIEIVRTTAEMIIMWHDHHLS
jgi:hypothetical protein